jgi:hypothetical protein
LLHLFEKWEILLTCSSEEWVEVEVSEDPMGVVVEVAAVDFLEEFILSLDDIVFALCEIVF